MGKVPFAESITLFGAFISGLPGNWHLNSASCYVCLDGQHFVIFYQAHRVRRATLHSLLSVEGTLFPVDCWLILGRLESSALELLSQGSKCTHGKMAVPWEGLRTVPSL